MTAGPLLSYIVLSYQYEQYIGSTLRSILDQTVQDFEIVVVDDASRDRSCDVVRSFADPRIRLLVNDRNMGGAWSYNRAVEAARGEWLVNLDSDDWIAPEKAERQLQFAEADPMLDIIGTRVNVVDAAGNTHPKIAEFDAIFRSAPDLNTLDAWIGTNYLCRSSTMVRRDTHLRIGLDDPTMVRAPDYELWMRALRHGCRFAVVPEPLTYLRVQSTGVTRGDPTGTLLEMTYAMLRNLVPLAEERAMLASLQRISTWVAGHELLSTLNPIEAYRLVGTTLLGLPEADDFAQFRKAISEPGLDAVYERCGRRYLAFLRNDTWQHAGEAMEPAALAATPVHPTPVASAEGDRPSLDMPQTAVQRTAVTVGRLAMRTVGVLRAGVSSLVILLLLCTDSRFFDRTFYRTTYGYSRLARRFPLLEFSFRGARWLQAPNRHFSQVEYARSHAPTTTYPPILHFLLHGRFQADFQAFDVHPDDHRSSDHASDALSGDHDLAARDASPGASDRRA